MITDFRVFALLALGSTWLSVSAQSGTLDPSFGSEGVVLSDLGETYENAAALALQPDGKVVLAGQAVSGASGYDPFVVRYLSDGTPDVTFSFDGHVSTVIDGPNARVEEVLVDALGKILVLVGVYVDGGDDRISLIRYMPNGALDLSFGSNGIAVPNVTGEIITHAMSILPDGGILLVGTIRTAGDPPVLLFMRVLSNGSLDDSIGTGGIVVHEATPVRSVSDMILRPDGRAVVCGSLEYSAAKTSDPFLATINEDGSLDAGFGSEGVVVTDLAPPYNEFNAIALRADGGIVATGTYDAATDREVLVASYMPTGEVEAGFSFDGLATFGTQDSWDHGSAIEVQPDGKILVSGWLTSESDADILLLRYLPNGILDPTFNGVGSVITQVGGIDENGRAMVLQPDGKILLGFDGYFDGGEDVGVLRYLNELTTGLSVTAVAVTGVSVQPNPADEQVILEYSVTLAGPVSCQLMDAQGRVVHEYLNGALRSSGPHSETIDLQGLPDAPYLLRLFSDMESTAVRIIKKTITP